MTRRSLLLLALLALAPHAAADPTDAPAGAIDARIELFDDQLAVIDAPNRLVFLANETPGERYVLELDLTKDYTTFEIHAHGFEVERPRQLVPSLALNESEYPLFHEFPTDQVWEADEPARVFSTSGTADRIVLRLGIEGPQEVTLVLERDVTPPAFTVGPVSELTHFSFYRETTTDELAIGDLQVRALGATEWVVNPTPVLHVRQRFPVQGLDPDTEYETRAVFADWAGNVAQSDILPVRTAPAPVAPAITITPLSPAPNATVPPGIVTMRASVESPGSPVARDAVRLFFDLTEVSDQIEVDGANVSYRPIAALAPGRHIVSVEATNEAGGKGLARWTFDIVAAKDAPFVPPLALAVALGVALTIRHRRKGP